MVKQYQIVIDPIKLAAFGVTQDQVIQAVRASNQEVGGSVLELAEAEYMVRASGYVESLEDFRIIPLAVKSGGTTIMLGDVGTIQLGHERRRGLAEHHWWGETAHGWVNMASVEQARQDHTQAN